MSESRRPATLRPGVLLILIKDGLVGFQRLRLGRVSNHSDPYLLHQFQRSRRQSFPPLLHNNWSLLHILAGQREFQFAEIPMQ